MIKNVLPEKVLFYIFYNMPNERAQIVAAESLEAKGWVYIPDEISWVRMKTLANGQSSFTRFNPELWQEQPITEE
jgi:CCR4-NOT transcriptional regulation complex NOT5 subunit